MNIRKITIDNESESKPARFMWQTHYRRRIHGHPMRNAPEYQVRIDSNGLQFRVTWCDTLTKARAVALREVKAGAAWAEIFRMAENGAAIKTVFIASYEVETESGAAIP